MPVRLSLHSAKLSAMTRELASDPFGGRSPGTEGEKKTIDWAIARFKALGLQPGGPQGWGTLALGDHDLPVVCFPGNPVSALVSFEAFLRPVLHDATGVGPVSMRVQNVSV